MTFWNTSFKTNGSASTTNRKPSVEESKSRYVRLPVVVVVVAVVVVVVVVVVVDDDVMMMMMMMMM